MNSVRLAVAAAAAGGTLLIGGCGAGNGGDGGADGMGGMGHGGPSASAGAVRGSFNNADVTFAQMMIPHHQQALEMSRLAPSRAADPELKRLAGQIEKAQDPEITTMRGWLRSWGKPVEAPGMGHSEHSGMEGMMSGADMKRLESLDGERFDRAFAEMMIAHHEGAVSMAEEEQRTGKNPDAKRLAATIAKAQTAEIRHLETILDQL